MPDQEQFAELPFPEKGIDVSGRDSEPPDGTTSLGHNVRLKAALGLRFRGGSRSGLSRYIDARVNGQRLIQELNMVAWIAPPTGSVGVLFENADPDVSAALFACLSAHGITATAITKSDDINSYRLVIVSNGAQLCGTFQGVYSDATFNANLLAYLEAGGRVFTHGEHGYNPADGGVDRCLQSRDYLNDWLSFLGAGMTIGGGGYVSNDGSDQFDPSLGQYSIPSDWINAGNPLASVFYGAGSANIHLGANSRSLFEWNHTPVFPYDLDKNESGYVSEPDNKNIMAIEPIGNGFLILGGDSDIFPGMAQQVTDEVDPDELNCEFFENLATFTDGQMAEMCV